MKMVISVGSNLEDPEAQVDRALDWIAEEFDLIAASSIYRTSPVGVTDQPEFRNAVAIIDAQGRTPREVLDSLHELEARAGRVRDVRWGPRTLDLDLIIADDVISDDPACTLPHPRAHERAFVLLPWLEIDPDAYLPGRGPIAGLVAGASGEVEQ
jgi:2-amino-4-hydroxy-6-hydroxymethyldihydropteridine diphosphokinase